MKQIKKNINNQNVCYLCNKNQYIIKNKKIICVTCGSVEKIKYDNIIDKNKNKIIHFNNVIKNLESINNNYIEELYQELKKTIKDENIDEEFVDSTYIYEFLKNKKIKNYIIDIWLITRYYNKDFKLNNQDKNVIKIIFKEYINYLLKNNLHINSISYHSILYKIYTYLEIDINIQPSITRNSNENVKSTFDDFLNYLCENNYGNKEKLYIPLTKKYNNLFYSKEFYN